VPLDSLTVAETAKPRTLAAVPEDPERWEALVAASRRTKTTADEFPPYVVESKLTVWSIPTPTRAAVLERSPRVRGARRGGPRARRSRVARRAQARSPGSSEPPGHKPPLVTSPGGAR
jgi:hypothetical protein